MTVREALALINQVLAEQEGDFKADSGWALAWFEQFGFTEGDSEAWRRSRKRRTPASPEWSMSAFSHSRPEKYGCSGRKSFAPIGNLARELPATLVGGDAGPQELRADWEPRTRASRYARRRRRWAARASRRLGTSHGQQTDHLEMVHHRSRVLPEGEQERAGIVHALGGAADAARELCYRLYAICDRKKRSAEALQYNTPVRSWSGIDRLARSLDSPQPVLFDLADRAERTP